MLYRKCIVEHEDQQEVCVVQSLASELHDAESMLSTSAGGVGFGDLSGSFLMMNGDGNEGGGGGHADDGVGGSLSQQQQWQQFRYSPSPHAAVSMMNGGGGRSVSANQSPSPTMVFFCGTISIAMCN